MCICPISYSAWVGFDAVCTTFGGYGMVALVRMSLTLGSLLKPIHSSTLEQNSIVGLWDIYTKN